MLQAERYFDFRDGKFSKNEFKAGDYVKFGRLWYHVRETSENPIIATENEQNEIINQSNKSLDNTNAEAFINPSNPISAREQQHLRLLQQVLGVRRNSDASPRSPNYLRAPEALRRAHQRISSSSVVSNAVDPDIDESWNVGETQEKVVNERITFTCRICLWDGDFDEEQNKHQIVNPLVSPCECSGTMKYIHFLWLKAWVESKRKFKSYMHVSTYYWKDLTWELCKKRLPETVSAYGHTLSVNFYH